MSSTLIFTNIQHVFRKKNALSCNEYILLDMVYHLQVTPKSLVKDWCYMSRDKMANELGVTKQSVLNLIKKLCDEGFLIKNELTKHLQTTPKWYTVYFKNEGNTDGTKSTPPVRNHTDGKESLPMVKKVYFNGKESLPHIGKESLPNEGKESLPYNNIIYNNIKDNNNYKQKDVEEKSTEILDLEVEEIFEEEKKEPEIFLKKKKEKIEKGCAEKEQKEKGEYEQYMAVYHSFFVELNGFKPKVDASDGSALKSLISHCKVLGKDKGSEGLKVFEAIVNASNWKYLNAFTQTQTTIRQINSCFNSIVTQLRNHKQVNKTPNKYIDGLIEANRINQQKIKDGTFNDDPFKDILQYKT